MPDHRQVERLVEVADICGAVAEEADGHGRIAAVLIRQRHPGRQGQMRADDGMAAPEVAADIGQVHRAAFALRGAGGLAEEFGHHDTRREAARDSRPVVAVGGDDPVFRPAHRKHAGADGFLPDV
jgi:hypothetical protein